MSGSGNCKQEEDLLSWEQETGVGNGNRNGKAGQGKNKEEMDLCYLYNAKDLTCTFCKLLGERIFPNLYK